MSFLNSFIFPTSISIGSAGGPRWTVEVTANDGGSEVRNQPWAYPLHEYDVAYGVKDVTDLQELVSIFNAAQAKLYAFRFVDPLDSKSCLRDSTPAYDDQTILASAAGGETSLQIYKNYTYGGATLARKITRPYGTTLLGINSVEKTEGTHFTVNYSTGAIDLTGGTAPNGALTATDEVTWGGTFHVPVRFDTNKLSIRLEDYWHGNTSVPLVEIRNESDA